MVYRFFLVFLYFLRGDICGKLMIWALRGWNTYVGVAVSSGGGWQTCYSGSLQVGWDASSRVELE